MPIRWKTFPFPLCTLDVPVQDLAVALDLPLVHWKEDGLGDAAGFVLELPSGMPLMLGGAGTRARTPGGQRPDALCRRTGPGAAWRAVLGRFGAGGIGPGAWQPGLVPRRRRVGRGPPSTGVAGKPAREGMNHLRVMFQRIKDFFVPTGRFRIVPRPGGLPDCRLRLLQEQDIEACEAIYRLNEPLHFPPGYFSTFSAWLRERRALIVVAEQEGVVRALGGINAQLHGHLHLGCLSFGMVHSGASAPGFWNGAAAGAPCAVANPQ